MSEWFARYGFGEVASGLLIGAIPADAGDVAALHEAGVERVVALVGDDEWTAPERAAVVAAYEAAGIEELRLPVADFGSLLPGVLERAARAAGAWLDEGRTVYVHCRAGWQRSATAAAAVLVARDGLSADAALAAVRHRRPVARPLEHQAADLRRWAAAR
jgi:protein-tyrosine phosphatase